MSAITTHILDTATGKPAAGIPVVLEQRSHTAGWQRVADGITDADGRLNDLLPPDNVLSEGHYRLGFELGPYFLHQGIECFFPQVNISFVVRDGAEHYHVPLLMSPFGYSTYRGS